MHQFVIQVIAAAFLSSPAVVATTPPASCTVDRQPATIVRSVTPDYPETARLMRVTGTAMIRVDLSDVGTVRALSVAVSSGNALLDQAAIRAARAMVFAPETRDCKPVPGSYGVEVDFTD